MINNIIKVVGAQVSQMNNIEFHKYWLDNFIVKNKETGKDILKFLKVNDLDTLFIKLNNSCTN